MIEPPPRGLTQTQSSLGSLFHLDEDILEAMIEPSCLWDAIHHRSFFLPENTFDPNKLEKQDIYAIESKGFLP